MASGYSIAESRYYRKVEELIAQERADEIPPAPEQLMGRDDKFHLLVARQQVRCAIAWDVAKQHVRPDCLHHARKHNDKRCRARYPLFVHSPWNLFAVCNSPWHDRARSWGKWPGEARAEAYEGFLRKPHHWKFRCLALLGRWPDVRIR